LITLGAFDWDDHLRDWRNNPLIIDWCRQRFEITEQEQCLWFKEQSQDLSIKMFAISKKTLKSGRKGFHFNTVGVAGFTDIDMYNRRAEFSLYIEPEQQQKGYGKQALEQLLKCGFEDFGFNRIWGEAFNLNPAIKMFLSVGMEREGTRQDFYYKNGRFIDAHLISIGREKWNKMKSCN